MNAGRSQNPGALFHISPTLIRFSPVLIMHIKPVKMHPTVSLSHSYTHTHTQTERVQEPNHFNTSLTWRNQLGVRSLNFESVQLCQYWTRTRCLLSGVTFHGRLWWLVKWKLCLILTVTPLGFGTYQIGCQTSFYQSPVCCSANIYSQYIVSF